MNMRALQPGERCHHCGQVASPLPERTTDSVYVLLIELGKVAGGLVDNEICADLAELVRNGQLMPQWLILVRDKLNDALTAAGKNNDGTRTG